MGDPKVRLILAKTENFLKRNLIMTNATIFKLKEAGVITEVACAKMLREPSVDQVVTLMSVLRKRSMTVFRKFLQILQYSMDGWIANRVLDTAVNEDPAPHNFLKTKTLREYLDNHFHDDSKPMDDVEIPMFGSNAIVDTNYHRNGHTNAFETRTSSDGFYNPNKQVLPYKLNEVHSQFLLQKRENEKSMSVLREEERMIKDLLYQNYREQAQINESQRALDAIDRRMLQVRSEAGQLFLQQSPSQQEARKRLQQLNAIPWHKYNTN